MTTLEAKLELKVGGTDRVELRLEPGQLSLLQGPPGCGKTTLLRCLAGLLPNAALVEGTLRLGATRYAPTGPCPPGVSWVQQDPFRGFLQPTVLEELASLEGAPPDEHLKRHLADLGIDPHQDPRDLSLGEAWRLALEAALHRYPTLLLLDEPSACLDGAGSIWMARRLEAYLAQGGCIVAAEHRPEVLGTLPTQRVPLTGASRVRAEPRPCDGTPGPLNDEPVLVLEALEALPGGRRRVGPLDLELRAGERVGLSGPNGCGKTTLLRVIAGLEPIAAGRLGGLPWRGIQARSLASKRGRTGRRGLRHLRRHLHKARLPRGLGLLPQRPDDLLFRPTVAAELADSGTACPALPRLLGLALDPEQDPITLSHGQRLMLATATVLGRLPPVVLLDEPSSWLDADGEDHLFRTLDHLQKRHGAAVLVASHDPALLARRCDRVAQLQPARKVQAEEAAPSRIPPRGDQAVLAVLALGVAGLAMVAATHALPWLWLEVALLLALLTATPGWRRSLRRIAKRGATLLLASTAVLVVLRGWPTGLELGLLATGKALGAWLPTALALRSVRRIDLRRVLTRVAGPRLGLAATLCISSAPLVERIAARSWEQARLRRLRDPLAVLVPVLLRIMSLATAQADMVALRSAGPPRPEGDPCPQPSD